MSRKLFFSTVFILASLAPFAHAETPGPSQDDADQAILQEAGDLRVELYRDINTELKQNLDREIQQEVQKLAAMTGEEQNKNPASNAPISTSVASQSLKSTFHQALDQMNREPFKKHVMQVFARCIDHRLSMVASDPAMEIKKMRSLHKKIPKIAHYLAIELTQEMLHTLFQKTANRAIAAVPTDAESQQASRQIEKTFLENLHDQLYGKVMGAVIH